MSTSNALEILVEQELDGSVNSQIDTISELQTLLQEDCVRELYGGDILKNMSYVLSGMTRFYTKVYHVSLQNKES